MNVFHVRRRVVLDNFTKMAGAIIKSHTYAIQKQSAVQKSGLVSEKVLGITDSSRSERSDRIRLSTASGFYIVDEMTLSSQKIEPNGV